MRDMYTRGICMRDMYTKGDMHEGGLQRAHKMKQGPSVASGVCRVHPQGCAVPA